MPIIVKAMVPTAFVGCTLLTQLGAAKSTSTSVEQFLRWRRRVPRQRYAAQASLLRLRTELYERQRRVAEDVDGGKEEEEEQEQEQEEEQEEQEEEEGQQEAQELLGKLTFGMITSEDVWRHIGNSFYTYCQFLKKCIT